mgnify:CR=1 FL=1
MVSHQVVRALLLYYTSLTGFTGPLHVFLSRERFEVIRRRRKYDESAAPEHKDFAATLTGRPPVTWVNLAKHRTVHALADTCAHEAVHIALPDLRHGEEFTRRKRLLLRGLGF